jgi:hypothetical protein
MRKTFKFVTNSQNVIKKLIILFILIITIISCNISDLNKKIKSINFEKISKDSSYFYTSFGDSIKTYSYTTNKESYKGKNSILLPSKKGLNIDTIPINNSQAIKVSIWRKGGNEAYLVFKNKNRDFLCEIKKASIVDENGWEKISYVFRLPPFNKLDTVLISLYNHSNEKGIYFDYMEISLIKNIAPNSKVFSSVELKIDSTNITKLLKYRKKALHDGLIKKENKKWVDAIFIYNLDTFDSKIRFKGDWLDHLQSNKWSIRVKIKGDNYWKGFKTFSLQNPDSKYRLDEYIYHEILEDNNILSPKYGFTPLIINSIFAGVFSYEEHFERQLVERQERREGPIIKLDEEPFWAVNYSNLKIGEKTLPIFNVSKIMPFRSKRIKKSKTLKNNLINAQNLLYTLKETEQIENIIDIEKFAEFYSIVDLTGAYHSLIWHNLRFYYNPISNLLEPIAFDGFTENGIFPWTNNKMTFECQRNGAVQPDKYIITKQFKNKLFTNIYFDYSKKINTKKYLSTFYDKKKNEINFYEKMLNIDYPDIKYNYKYLENRASNNFSVIAKKDSYKEINNYKTQRNISKKYPLSLAKSYINSYPTIDTTQYIIENYNSFELFIVGYSKNKNDTTKINELKINTYKNGNYGLYKFVSNKKIKYIYLTDINKLDTFRIKINKFIKPQIYNPKKDILSNIKDYSNILSINNNTILFKTGNYTINIPVIIPSGYKVIMNKNTNIDFINESYLLSYSPIFINGTEDEPVNFFSSDKSAKGITIVKANQVSSVNYLYIKDFDTFSQNNWKLTGAITFYNSNVDINNMKISDNKCEDAINIVNSLFTAHNCIFENIFSDAFDSDFSDGEIINCIFSGIGNDAIDFSGSKAKINNCKMFSIGDKAISAGEKSNLKTCKILVKNANIAFASKDKSSLSVDSSDVNNCMYAYASYIKKTEFGASELNATNNKITNTKQLLLIDKDCIIAINNNKKIGTERIDIKKLYEKYKK